MFSRMAGLVAVVVFCLAVASLNSQTTAGQKSSLQSRTIPQWQTAAGGKMEFEVASIRLAGPGPFRPPSFALNIDDDSIPPGGRFFADFPLEVYIEFAYKIMLTRQQKDAMLARLPEWSRNDTFVIQAEAAGNPTKDQMRLMMQSLLADRFKLSVHFEIRQVPVFVLLVDLPGKLGPLLQPHRDDSPCATTPWIPSPPPGGLPETIDTRFPATCGGILSMAPSAPGRVRAGARNVSMELIASSMTGGSSGLDRPVLDKTGLNGMFDIAIEFTPQIDGPSAPGANFQPDPTGPTFVEALKEQLGLKVEAQTGPVDVLVVDYVEEPSAN
jgi:bla regulator protein blaR1